VNGSTTKQINFTININDVSESPVATKYNNIQLFAPLGDNSSKTFFSLNIGEKYSNNEASSGATSDNIDFGYYYGFADNASLASPNSYPASQYDLSSWSTRNATIIFKSNLSTTQFDALNTNADIQAAFDAQTNSSSETVTGLAVGDVIAFKTSSSKSTGADKIAFAKVLTISGTFNAGDYIELEIIYQK